MTPSGQSTNDVVTAAWIGLLAFSSVNTAGFASTQASWVPRGCPASGRATVQLKGGRFDETLTPTTPESAAAGPPRLVPVQ